MSRFRLAVCSLLGIAIAGCGGGGGGQGGTTPVGGQEQQVGPLSIVSKEATPQVATANSGVITVTSLSASNFTSAKLAATRNINSTRIAYWHNNRVNLVAPDGSHREAIPMPPFVQSGTKMSFSPDCTKVVFGGTDITVPGSTKHQIFVINVDGTGLKRLTNGKADDYNPCWSVSNRIYYQEGDSLSEHIYSMDPTGGSIVRLTSGDVHDHEPTCSFDGSKVAFSRSANQSALLWVVDASGANAHRWSTYLDDRQTVSPSFSPDGTSLLYMSYGTDSTSINEVTANGLAPSTLLNGQYNSSPSYSPDGRSFSYIYSADNTSYELRLFDFSLTTSKYLGAATNACWSPFPTARTMVGSGGVLGAGAGALLVSQDSAGIQSVVAVDATTRTSVQATQTGEGGGTLVYKVSGGGIKTIYYVNGVRTSRLSLSAGTTPYAGVLVSFDPETGYVSSLVPFSKVNPSIGKLSGEFLGVFDGKGNRVAGAGSSVSFDRKGKAALR